MSYFTPHASFVALFSEGPIGSPVSKTPSGESNAIKNRRFGDRGLTFSFSTRDSFQSQSTDTGRGDESRGYSQSKWVCGVIYFGPRTATANSDRAHVRVNLGIAQTRKIDH